MSDAVLHVTYGRNAAKQIARDFGIAVRTAKHWLRFGFPLGREDQVRAIVVRRLEEQAAGIADTLNLIRGNANEAGSARSGVGARARGGSAQQGGTVARKESPG